MSRPSLPVRSLCLVVAIATARTHTLDAQAAPDSAPRWAADDSSWDVSLSLTRRTLEVRFPAVPLVLIGCPYPDSTRGFQWQVTNNFRDERHASSHFMYAGAYFRLPTSLPITEARLDSALAAATISVDEAGGEPPMRISTMSPSKASLRYLDGRVVLRIDDARALRAFKRTGGKTAAIFWCERDVHMNIAYRPLRP